MKKILVLLLLVLVSQCEKALSTDSHDTYDFINIAISNRRFFWGIHDSCKMILGRRNRPVLLMRSRSPGNLCLGALLLILSK